MPPAARSIEELFPLIEFCKNGDLKSVSDWITKGNRIDLPPGKKTRRAGPLQIAIEKGFLTLTETLLDVGFVDGNDRVETLLRTAAGAVTQGQPDFGATQGGPWRIGQSQCAGR